MGEEPEPESADTTAPKPTRARRVLRTALVLVGVLAVVIAGAVTWMHVASSGHRHTAAAAPSAPVVIAFGAKLQDGRAYGFLAGRLEVTARLVREGKARAVLVSGAGNGTSGDEPKAMTAYLTEHGVDRRKIIEDPHGLDTYDTCARAVRVYGIKRALVVTQAYHLPRTVTLCRSVGMDADGVEGACDGCLTFTLARNRAREWLSSVGAIADVLSQRDPAVLSTSDGSVTDALVRP